MSFQGRSSVYDRQIVIVKGKLGQAAVLSVPA